MTVDLHVHTEFSCDSEADMEAYAQSAIDRNVDVVCFTDHVDWNRNDFGYGYYKPRDYFDKLNKVKRKYGHAVRLLSGIEFGEPHLYADALRELSANPYDYIIGSIHWIGDLFPCKKVREQYTSKEFYTLYWEEVLSAVKQGGFDALGHMDFPKRYFGEIYYREDKMKEIFQRLLEKDMVIEINTSSLRKGHRQAMPGAELLEIYRENGGRYVTVGSDAHEVKDLSADYDAAKESIARLALQEVIYVNREREVLYVSADFCHDAQAFCGAE
ncbi:MAG: histidinol-phosphatase HisJ family protein [Roseburia sp.]|nr:histidinol-phosphatase HisJ family protein [Roseburia sp.]